MFWLKNHKLQTISLFVFLGLYLVFMCFQGLDLADECFWLSNARYILTDPQSVTYAFSYWFSVLTTALWGKIFSDSILSLRILNALVKFITAIVAYLILRKDVQRGPLAVGVIWGVFLSTGSTNVLYGSAYTGFFYVCASAVLILAFRRQSRVLFFAGGVILGLSVLARIPNVTSIGFALTPLAMSWLMRRRVDRRDVSYSMALLAGWMCGLMVMVALMFLLSHGQYFLDMLSMFREIAEGGHHSIKLLICVQLAYYARVLVMALALFGGVFLIGKINRYVDHAGWQRIGLCFLYVAFGIMVFWGSTYYSQLRPAVFIPVGLFWVSAFRVLLFGHDKTKKPVWMVVGVMLAIQPLGSDVPFEANKFVLPLVMPLCVGYLLRYSPDNSSGAMKVCIVSLISAMFAISIVDIARDAHDRSRLTCSVESIPEFKGIYTTKERAESIKELVVNVRCTMGDERLLLTFPCMPGLYALADKTPYIEGTWSRLFSANQFECMISRAKKRYRDRLPYVLEEKWNTAWPEWPGVRLKYIDQQSRHYPLVVAVRDFLRRNRYRTVWENEDFILHEPAK